MSSSRPPRHRRSYRPSVARRWCARGGLNCAKALTRRLLRGPGAYEEYGDVVDKRDRERFGDQAVHRLVVTVILRPTFAGPGPTSQAQMPVSVVFAARSARPVHTFGAMPGRGHRKLSRADEHSARQISDDRLPHWCAPTPGTRMCDESGNRLLACLTHRGWLSVISHLSQDLSP